MPCRHHMHAPNFKHIHFVMVDTNPILQQSRKAYILPKFPLILNQVSSRINLIRNLLTEQVDPLASLRINLIRRKVVDQLDP